MPAQALPGGLIGKLSSKINEPGPSRTTRADDCAPPASDIEDALVPQVSIGTENGVHVHAQRVGQIRGSRQDVALAEVTVGDRRPDLRGDLNVERLRGSGVDLHTH